MTILHQTSVLLPAENGPSRRVWLNALLNPPEDASPASAAFDTLSPPPRASGISQKIAKSTYNFPSLLSGFLSFVPPAPAPVASTPSAAPALAPALAIPAVVASSPISGRHGANAFYNNYHIPPYYYYDSYYHLSWYAPPARDVLFVQPLQRDAHEAIEIEMKHQTIPPTPTSTTSSIEIEILDISASDSTDLEESIATATTYPSKACNICHATYSSGNWYKHKDQKTGGYMCKSCYVCLNRRLKTMKKSGPVDIHAAISSVLESKRNRSMSSTSAANRRALSGIKRNEGKVCARCGSSKSSGDWYRDHGNLEQDDGLVNCQRCYQRMKKLKRVQVN